MDLNDRKNEENELEVKNKVPLILCVAAIVIILVGGGYVFGKDYIKSLFRTPEELLIESYVNTLKTESGRILTTFELESFDIATGDDEADRMIEGVLRNLKVQHGVTFSDANTVQGEIRLQLLGSMVLKAEYTVTEEYMIVDIPILFEKPLYIDNDQLKEEIYSEDTRDYVLDNSYYFGNVMPVEYYNLLGFMFTGTESGLNEEVTSRLYEEYKDLLELENYEVLDEIQTDLYKQIIVAYLEEQIDSIEEGEFELSYDDSMVIEGTRYEVDYNKKDMTRAMSDLLLVLSEDEQLRQFCEEVAVGCIDRVIDNKDGKMYALLMTIPSEEVDEWNSVYEDELTTLKLTLIESIDDFFDGLGKVTNKVDDALYWQRNIDVSELTKNIDLRFEMDVDHEDYLRGHRFIVESSFGDGPSEDIYGPSMEMIKTLNFNVAVEFDQLDEGVELPEVDKSMMIDLMSMSDEEKMLFFEETGLNIQEYFLENPLVSEIYGGFLY